MENRLKHLIGILVMTGLMFKLMSWEYGNEMLVVAAGSVFFYSIYKLTKGILIKYIIGLGFGLGFLLKGTSQAWGNEVLLITWLVGIVYCVYRIIKG